MCPNLFSSKGITSFPTTQFLLATWLAGAVATPGGQNQLGNLQAGANLVGREKEQARAKAKLAKKAKATKAKVGSQGIWLWEAWGPGMIEPV